MDKTLEAIHRLIAFALHVHLIDPLDTDYVYNRLCHLLDIPAQTLDTALLDNRLTDLEDVLAPLLDFASENACFKDTSEMSRDRFAALLMDVFMPRPSYLQKRFDQMREHHPQQATDDYYQRAVHSRYIRTDLIAKNHSFPVETPYGTLKVTINLGKPEKDPQAIRAALKQKTDSYPACLLCKEHVGHYGEPSQPARTNHRIIKMTLGHEPFYLQYSPYAYYHEHAIVLHARHVPMQIDTKTYHRLFDFVDAFPHYFIGSNADLPIVGGSMLSHEHYQGGLSHFPIETARAFKTWHQDTVTTELLSWPISTIKMRGHDRESLIQAADALRQYWMSTENTALDIIPSTNDERHNAVTLVVRKEADQTVIYTMLRNNRTTVDRPDGRFHVHPKRHAIKKENIGLIEAMGLAILPGRLALDLPKIATALDWTSELWDSELKPYYDWMHALQAQTVPQENRQTWLEAHVGMVFTRGLEDCGVFPQTPDGKNTFIDWMEAYYVKNYT